MTRIIGMGQGGMQPSTPTIGTATGGDAQASVEFTPSTYIGKSTIVYRAISNPGSVSSTSTSSPITVTGLSNGTAYTFTVQGETPYGVNSLASAASNSVTPASVAGYFESIATVNVGAGGAATISFTSIPQTYRHLQIRGMVRGETTLSRPAMRFENDNGANYWASGLTGFSGSTGGYFDTNQTYIDCNICPTSSEPANVYGPMVIDIMNYTSTSRTKTIISLAGQATYTYIAMHSGTWDNTSPIARIDFVPGAASAGDFNQFTHIALYGIKESV